MKSPSFFDVTKAITYVHGPKMKRDASVKVVFLGRKKTTFTEASLFIFGPSSYVTVLIYIYIYTVPPILGGDRF